MSFTDELVALVAAKIEAWRKVLDSQADVSSVDIRVQVAPDKRIRLASCSVQTSWRGPTRRSRRPARGSV